jgi:tripartite-type tricarboxylate transporter receptor subunit TctC
MKNIVSFIFLLLSVYLPVKAQEAFPNKPITIINPNPPGGFVDNVGRGLAISLQKISLRFLSSN